MTQEPVVPWGAPGNAPGKLSRRRFLGGAGGASLLAAVATTAPVLLPDRAAAAAARPPAPDGTPEQIHLTWGADPATAVNVSWASTGQAVNPRVTFGLGSAPTRTAHAVQRIYTDGISGETVFTYHAALVGLTPDAAHHYRVISDNAAPGTVAFSSRFRTAPAGRAAYRFTSFGDLATPNTHWVESYGQSAAAVRAIESRRPLFHLLNGDLSYANLNPTSQPEVWRDFARNVQVSAANRPWMPCPGNHEIEFGNGPQGLNSYLTRYTLPDNGVKGFRGRWYSFRVGSALFVSLDADDVVYQDGAAFVPGPSPLTPAARTGHHPIPAGTSAYVRGYSGGAQTTWLERTLSAARADDTIDWIVVQMHQDALSSSATGNGSDLGIRQAWLPLFDQYQVDLVVCGHDHDYERSFPVRGADSLVGREVRTGRPVETLRPRPVTTIDNGVFDTSLGTVHLILGGGGTDVPHDRYGVDPQDKLRQAKVFTKPNRPVKVGATATFARAAADAVEDATWSAKRDPATGYGMAVFDLDPGTAPGGPTSITVTYYHAPGADPGHSDTGNANPATTAHPTSEYREFETFTLTRTRRDGPGTALPEMSSAAIAVGAAALIGGGALYVNQHRRSATQEAG